MKIEHIGMWVKDLERMKAFYTEYFEASAGEKYHNPVRGFTSYFLTFASGSRLELMTQGDVKPAVPHSFGLAHLALSVADKVEVDHLTTRLQQDGYEVVGLPRTTGDGYYEAVVADPEGNLIEITC